MAKPEFSFSEVGDFLVCRFEIPGGITSPEEFSGAVEEVAARLSGPKPVLFNGRGPVWGFGMLLHAAHPTPAVGTFDPRLGYVVVESHDSRFAVGSVIPDPEA